MKQICQESLCTGCGACATVCPKGCISMEYNGEGFLFPVVRQDLCTDCDACRTVCRKVHAMSGAPIRNAYHARTRDAAILMQSSSGGMALEFAKAMFAAGGAVFGVRFSEGFSEAHHACAETMAQAQAFCGSKYIGSRTGSVYRDVRDLLKAGRRVLFTGTPCQCAALRAVLGHDDEHLITVDFPCRGVASTGVFRQYLASLSANAQIVSISPRDKGSGYFANGNHAGQTVVKFADGTGYCSRFTENPFHRAFAKGVIDRLSCSTCRFASAERVSDITIADCFFDLSEEEARTGCSLVMTNTEKGERFFSSVRGDLDCTPVSREAAIAHQKHLRGPSAENPHRAQAFRSLRKAGFSRTAEEFFLHDPGQGPLDRIRARFSSLLRRLKKLMGKS